MEDLQLFWADVQQFAVGTGFVILGFFFRAHLEKRGALHRKLSSHDWLKLFEQSGISRDAAFRWHEELRKQQPKLFDTLSTRVDF